MAVITAPERDAVAIQFGDGEGWRSEAGRNGNRIDARVLACLPDACQQTADDAFSVVVTKGTEDPRASPPPSSTRGRPRR